MKASDIPTKFNIPFADAAGGGFIRPIPEASQIGITTGAASLHDGFPPVNFLPIGAGGTPPFGEDFNGILNEITLWSRWQNAGASVTFDSVFAAAIGGYPAGTMLRSTAQPFFWLSTADDNTTDPDGGSPAGWIPFGTANRTRTITASGAFTILATDYSIGLARTSAVATSSTQLPSTTSTPDGRDLWIEDLIGNFAAFPVTVSPGAGQTIAGLPSFTLNNNRSCVRFRFYASGPVWSVKI